MVLFRSERIVFQVDLHALRLGSNAPILWKVIMGKAFKKLEHAITTNGAQG